MCTNVDAQGLGWEIPAGIRECGHNINISSNAGVIIRHKIEENE
jgi:hypothetical protein